jgi:predicted transcriptional regulator YheO
MAQAHNTKPASPQRAARVALPRQTVDGERLLALFQQLVEPIGRALPASSEVVLHDLSRLPNSIVAVYGDVTGRRPGDPATDLLLKKAASGSFENSIGYETRLPDGRRLKSSTMIVRDVSGTPVLAFCINSDISVWQSVSVIARQMLGEDTVEDPAPARGTTRSQDAERSTEDSRDTAGEAISEVFVRDVDELAAALLHQARQEVGVPVELMHKRHKLEVVRVLKARGFFMLRDAVEMVASALQVTRFTIYNYLNELGDDDSTEFEAADTTPEGGASA